MRVYHFLNTTYAISNLSLKRLKVSRFSQLNDPFELLAADLLDSQDQAALAGFKNNIDKSKGMICFSAEWSNPLLWGHYAEKHSGMALGFDIPDNLLAEVKYTAYRPKIVFDPQKRRVVDGQSVMDRLIRTKFIDWKYEDEHRMFVELDPSTQEAGNYFIDFSPELLLREVILGLKCELPVTRVKQLLGNDVGNVKVLKAGMSRRSFKVIEDRTARPSKNE
jgi:hypothetical protein